VATVSTVRFGPSVHFAMHVLLPPTCIWQPEHTGRLLSTPDAAWCGADLAGDERAEPRRTGVRSCEMS
jgi:hypothetical protein